MAHQESSHRLSHHPGINFVEIQFKGVQVQTIENSIFTISLDYLRIRGTYILFLLSVGKAINGEIYTRKYLGYAANPLPLLQLAPQEITEK